MSRDNFFSKAPNADDRTRSKDSTKSDSQALVATPSLTKIKRETYSIKIDPQVRKAIKAWAIQHDVTISSVIETLAQKYLPDLSESDIRRGE